MEKLLEVLVDDVKTLNAKQDAQNETLTRLTVSVEEHVKRTNLLEEEMRPVKKHVELVNACAKIASFGGALLMAAKQLGLF